ncbi:MAG TPA: S41 family peptidase [Candidatus Woesebacteria bacterium]|nr:S41 family peptidase [Candidatus Woesebacteria bacterium]
MKFWRRLIIDFLVLFIVIRFSYNYGRWQGTGGLDLSLMRQVKNELEDKYLDKTKINDNEMKYGAIRGLVASLGDPYTVFLSPKENKGSNEDLAGQFGGVGISLGYKDKTLAVMAPLPKSPAEKAGILAGDLILKITDEKKGITRETNEISLQEAVSLIRGEVGTEVTLKLYREGNEDTFDVTLKRDNIMVAGVELEWLEDQKIAWIKLSKFTDSLLKEWPMVVDEILSVKTSLDGKNFKGIILDLRNNPGGYLTASVLVGSDFINEGVIVKQESRHGATIDYQVDPSRKKLLDDKLVVLVNGGSASAAEILAGALQFYQRAELVGEKTFGKGTIQEPENFSDGSGIHITIAKWLLPDSRNIHDEGVSPDIEVKGDKAQLEKAKAILLK